MFTAILTYTISLSSSSFLSFSLVFKMLIFLLIFLHLAYTDYSYSGVVTLEKILRSMKYLEMFQAFLFLYTISHFASVLFPEFHIPGFRMPMLDPFEIKPNHLLLQSLPMNTFSFVISHSSQTYPCANIK